MFAPVLALLNGTGFTVYDGDVDSDVEDADTFPYVVVFSMTPELSENSLDNTSRHAEMRFRVHSVGLSAESVRIVAGAVQDALADAEVGVSGWVTRPIRHLDSLNMRQDRDVTIHGQHPLFAVDTYLLSAERA